MGVKMAADQAVTDIWTNGALVPASGNQAEQVGDLGTQDSYEAVGISCLRGR